MKRSYLGAVAVDDGSYEIVFRDLPGCVSVGDTLDDVLAMGAEALSGHVAAMLDNGDAVPEPTAHDLSDVITWLQDGDDHGADALRSGWVGLFPIEVDVTDVPGLVTIRVRGELVRQIAEMAEETAQKLDSRAFIERAVEHELDTYRKSAA